MFLRVYFLTLLYIVRCAPVQENSMYTALVAKCPHLPDTLKTSPILEACPDWKKISEISNSTESDPKDVRCLLYYEAFSQYCTSVEKVTTEAPNEVLVKYQMPQICTFASNTSNPVLNSIFSNKTQCEKVCYFMGLVHPLCSLSYYFAELTAKPLVNKQTNKPVSNTTAESVAKAPEALPVHQTDEHESAFNPPQEEHPADTDFTLVEAKTAVIKSEPRVQSDNGNPALANVNAETEQSQNKPEHTDANKSLGKPEVNEDPAPPIQPQIDNKNAQPEPIQDDQMQDEDVSRLDEDDSPVNPPILSDKPEKIQESVVPIDESGPVKLSKPLETEDISDPVNYDSELNGDSYFFTYFMILCVLFVAAYVCYHNKQKILALILEGRRSKRQYRGRRPNSANYHKLDSNLEEAINSTCKKNTNNVIY